MSLFLLYPRFIRWTDTLTTPHQLAFRQTVYAYGADLCWTPMILAKEFNRSHFARESGESQTFWRGVVSSSLQVPEGLSMPLPSFHTSMRRSLTPNRLHYFHSRPTAYHHCSVRLQLCARVFQGLCSGCPLRQRRRPELRLPTVLGLCRGPRSSSHGEAGARPGYCP